MSPSCRTFPPLRRWIVVVVVLCAALDALAAGGGDSTLRDDGRGPTVDDGGQVADTDGNPTAPSSGRDTGTGLGVPLGGGQIAIRTEAATVVWIGVLVGLASIVFVARIRLHGWWSLFVVGGALATMAVPVHAACALALLAFVAVRRRSASVPLLLAMGAALATVPESAAEMWARGLAMTVGYALPWVGIPVVLDGNTVGIGGHLLMVDPACAAVEGLAIGIAASAAVRTLAGDPARVVAGFAGAHGAAFALANLMRIASVGVALALVPESAETVHAVGGPLLLLVHAAFLARPVRRLFAQHRPPVQRRTGGTATDLALPAGPAAVASG